MSNWVFKGIYSNKISKSIDFVFYEIDDYIYMNIGILLFLVVKVFLLFDIFELYGFLV